MMNIRNFKKNDLSKIGFLQPDGWEDIITHFKFFEHTNFCNPVVAEINSKIVGVANCLVNKGSGWISHIIVSNEYREQGIGYKLTKHVMGILLKNNCSTQLLIATKMGENLYQKLGFKKSTHYNFYIGKQLDFPQDKNIRQLNKSDLRKIYNLDLLVSGEYRENMIKNFVSDGYVFEEKKSAEITGYYLPNLGNGIVIAFEGNTGIELLKLKHTLNICKTVLPEDNIAGNEFFKEQNFELYNQAYRMVYGDEVNWNPQSVFCRIGGYYA